VSHPTDETAAAAAARDVASATAAAATDDAAADAADAARHAPAVTGAARDRVAGQLSGPARPAGRRPARNGVIHRLQAIGRFVWRGLTSMRTALILLFLLAVGSLPAALLPQWYLNQTKTAQYISAHPTLGPLLDRLGFFDVVASPWYSAIYLMLAISLVGCIAPRSLELVRQWRAKPGRAPKNLARLPHHAVVTVDGEPAEAAERIRVALRHKGFGGWRTVVRSEESGGIAISAERGYLREVGNLVFHIAVLGLLFTMGIGSLFGYTGSVLVTEGDAFCSSAPVMYDNFAPGRMVDGTDMTPFCVDVEKFEAAYDDQGLAKYYRAQLGVQVGEQTLGTGFTQRTLNVNEPLRLGGQRLYLLGHGYVPQFTVSFPDGQTREYSAPFEPKDQLFTSEGVVKITDPPGYASGDTKNQLAIVGIFAPSGIISGGVLTSGYPELLAPAVAIEVYRGDLGLDHGSPQSIFAIDTTQVDKGLLVSQGRANLNLGESMRLADGTVITFSGAKNFVSLQTSYDPVQGFALLFAILLIGGILVSLTIKRRRVWYRITPMAADEHGVPTLKGRSLVRIGGLARTDQAGYGSEFDSLVEMARSDSAPPHPGAEPTAGGARTTDTPTTDTPTTHTPTETPEDERRD
jgi:cytochrome c biogenesis protein